MPGLDIITDAILNKAKADREAILNKADEKKQEILKEAKAEAESLVLEIKKESLKEIENIHNSIKARAEQELSRGILKKKTELISEVLNEAKEYVYAMPDEEYNKLLLSLLSKYAKQEKSGEISFCENDKQRVSAEVKNKIKALNLTISFEDKNIKRGFVLKYGKVEENCSIEAVFHQNCEKVTDFLNKELFHRERKCDFIESD